MGVQPEDGTNTLLTGDRRAATTARLARHFNNKADQ
jgi:hypothetical protein